MVTSATPAADITASEQALAASAHSRINMPLNLDNWRALDADVQADLLWLHQHALDNRMDWGALSDAIGYDKSTVFRVLKGTYEGSWANIVKAIRSYKRIAEQRGSIQRNQVVENSIVRMISAGLDYALANNSITTIIGESRMGKTVAVRRWRDMNNHGTSVLVTAPPYGGTKMFLRILADAVGANKNLSIPQLYEALIRAFNANRIVIVDEAHRLMPGDRRTTPTVLEIIRDIHDRTNCAVALVATQRFDDDLRRSMYQYEQILGRIGMPIRLYRDISDDDWMPIVAQYLTPSKKLVELFRAIANEQGRLGILVEICKVASRIAAKAKERVGETHILKAIKLRKQMMGQRAYAAKEQVVSR